MTTEASAPQMRVVYQHQLTRESGFTFEVCVDRDSDKAVLDGVLDKMSQSARRQAYHHDIIVMQHDLENAGTQIQAEVAKLTELHAQMEADAARWIESGRRGDYKPKDAQAAAIVNAKSTIEGLTTRRDQVRKRLAELEELIKG